ncbi:MAG: Crp/Fnr family transcriptional regulator [Myxococcota bacterium]
MSPRDERIQRLQKTALFGATAEETVAFVLERAPEVRVSAGEWFFREDERGTAIYWLEEGQVAIHKRRAGHEVALRRLEVGDCFGEVALFDFGPRSASVRAVEDCLALEISSALLREVAERDLEQFTLLTMNLGRELARRLRAVEEHLFEVTRAWARDEPTPLT